MGVVCLKTQNGNAFSSRLTPPSLKSREVHRLSRVAIVARLNFSLDILETSLYTQNKSFAGLVSGPQKRVTDQQTDRPMDGQSKRWTDRRTDGRTHPFIWSWLTWIYGLIRCSMSNEGRLGHEKNKMNYL